MFKQHFIACHSSILLVSIHVPPFQTNSMIQFPYHGYIVCRIDNSHNNTIIIFKHFSRNFPKLLTKHTLDVSIIYYGLP